MTSTIGWSQGTRSSSYFEPVFPLLLGEKQRIAFSPDDCRPWCHSNPFTLQLRRWKRNRQSLEMTRLIPMRFRVPDCEHQTLNPHNLSGFRPGQVKFDRDTALT